MTQDDPAAPLREAIAYSPDNVPLRLHLARTLLAAGQAGEAEGHFREALRLAPDSLPARLGLADAFARLDKHGEALVVLESALGHVDLPPGTWILHARLLIRAGERDRAGHSYRRALEFDPALRDDDLAQALGVLPTRPVGVSLAIPPVTQPSGSDPDAFPADSPQRPAETFADVGGMEDVKEEIRLKIIHPLRHQDLYRAYGKSIGGGILLYGPPGCGKTHLARATAGEIGAGFIAVGINEILDVWLGQSEKNLHAIFEQARRTAPSVLFFDEIDALASRRSDRNLSAARHVINQFLEEMDGVRSSNDGVLVLGATNAPWLLDPAFRRPGRFDRVLFVPPPDQPARETILRIILEGKPTADIDTGKVGRATEDYSGADLRSVVDVAVEDKLRDAMRTGVPQPLRTGDLLAATKRVRPSTAEWTASARNHALYANEGGAWDDVVAYLRRRGKL